MAIFREIRKVTNRLVWGMPDRYGHLYNELRENRPRTIMEIGVWNGERSRKMIQCVLENNIPPKEIQYYGFDLFESADESMVHREASKFPPTMEVVRNKLRSFADMGVSISLYKGDTIQLLPTLVPHLPEMEFVFIDGGHSYETVKNDWECVKPLMGERTVVIFDDYVNEAGVVNMNFGVNKLVDKVDRELYAVSLLNPVDSFRKEWGILKIRFVKVTLKSGRGLKVSKGSNEQ